MSTYYVDYTTGDDGDSGLTEALAWKTCAQVNGFTFAPGDSILFKCGETWTNDMLAPAWSAGACSGSVNAPITIGSYGTGAKPILQTLRTVPGSTVAGNWTDYSGTVPGTWYMDLSGINNYTRMKINGDEVYNPDTADHVTEQLPWWWGNIGGTNRLLVYSPGVNPSTLAIQDNIDVPPLIIGGLRYVNVENLDVRGGHPCFTIRSKNGAFASAHIRISDCNIGEFASSGLVVTTAGDDGTVNCADVVVEDCVIDGCYPLHPATSYSIPGGGCDGVKFIACDGFEIVGCIIARWTHVCLYLGEVTLSDIRGTATNGLVHNNIISGDDFTYCHAIGVDAFTEDGCCYNEVYDNVISHTTVRCQLNGTYNSYYRNVFIGPNVRPPLRVAEISEAIDVTNYQGVCHDNEYSDNVVSGCVSVGLRVRNGYYDNTHHLFSRNRFIDCGNDPTPITPTYSGIAMYLDDSAEGTVVDNNTYIDNIVVEADPTADTIQYRGVPMTVDEFNAENGHDDDVILRNVRQSSAVLPAVATATPQLSNISMFSGDTAPIVETLNVDLTGCPVSWVLAAYPGGPALVTKAATVTDLASGEISVALDAADTNALPAVPGHLYYREVQVTDYAGVIKTLLYGRFLIRPDSA